jgi:hypothetical protein
MPAQLSQFWKWRLKERGCVGLVVSGIAATIYRRLEKKGRNGSSDYRFLKAVPASDTHNHAFHG